MGLTVQSVGNRSAGVDIKAAIPKGAKIIALAGNPNVGKSTLFNKITGMKQHTGNWPGKTVTNAVGEYKDEFNHLAFVDIPGTYSLIAHSAEEEVARDFLVFGEPDLTVVVCDATCLERNLNLVLQVAEICPKVVVCVNLLDEAKKKGIFIDLKQLSTKLGLPVVGTSAQKGGGIKELINVISTIDSKDYTTQRIKVAYSAALENAINLVEQELNKILTFYNNRWLAIRLLENDIDFVFSLEQHLGFSVGDNTDLSAALIKAKKGLESAGVDEASFKNYLVSGLVLTAEAICDDKTVRFKNADYHRRDFKIDKIVTGKITGPICMIALLALVLWITVSAANYPSSLLWSLFSFLEAKLFDLSLSLGVPYVISDMLFHGAFRVLFWVVSVMLPPMAIFFPLFTLLEDLGYLPRIAFNLDKGFKRCSACGKQALTMCMGFGCNAAGITGCRIIDSRRERLIAIITNNFVPCNGRFPTIIAIILMFLVGSVGSSGLGDLLSSVILTLVILLGVGATFLVSKVLALTVLKGQPSSFTLELPPYRKPQIGSVIVRSIFDRTVFVLLRAMAVAAPAGLVIWLLANITVNDITLLSYISGFLDPIGNLLGMDGTILLGFILGFPANEIVIPIIIMAYMGEGTLADYGSLFELKELLINNGWTLTTAICTIVFSLMHWPCSTAILTAKKETGSLYWSFITFITPTLCGMLICFIINLVLSLF